MGFLRKKKKCAVHAWLLFLWDVCVCGWVGEIPSCLAPAAALSIIISLGWFVVDWVFAPLCLLQWFCYPKALHAKTTLSSSAFLWPAKPPPPMFDFPGGRCFHPTLPVPVPLAPRPKNAQAAADSVRGTRTCPFARSPSPTLSLHRMSLWPPLPFVFLPPSTRSTCM